MEYSENQDAPANEDTDKDEKTEKVEKEKPDDKTSEKISDTEHECLVKQETLPLFAASENMEQCDLSSNLDFTISRSSDISKDNDTISRSSDVSKDNEEVNQSAIPPSVDIVDNVASSSSTSNANCEKKEASLQESSDQQPKKWYLDPESSDENDFSNEDFESFDFNEGDLMDEEDLDEEGLNEEEEEEIPQRRIHEGPIEVVDLSSDSENFEEKLVHQDAKCPESNAQASGSDSEALVPVNLCLDDLVPVVENVASPPAPLPAVDVHEIIPVINISDEENEEKANEAAGLPAAAEEAVQSGIKHPIEEAGAEGGFADAKRSKQEENEPDAPDEL